MSYLGDTLTVSLILVLLFGSIALYLYTRVQQTEQKVSLLESIVLDLKLTGEIQPFSGLSDHEHDDRVSSFSSSASSAASSVSASSVSVSSAASSVFASSPIISSSHPVSEAEHSVSSNEMYVPFKDLEEVEVESEPLGDASVEFLPLDQDLHIQEEPSFSPVSYDSMSLKELQAQVRSRALPMEKGAKKHTLIELLKQHDAEQVGEVKPGSMSSSTILESFSHDE